MSKLARLRQFKVRDDKSNCSIVVLYCSGVNCLHISDSFSFSSWFSSVALLIIMYWFNSTPAASFMESIAFFVESVHTSKCKFSNSPESEGVVLSTE